MTPSQSASPFHSLDGFGHWGDGSVGTSGNRHRYIPYASCSSADDDGLAPWRLDTGLNQESSICQRRLGEARYSSRKSHASLCPVCGPSSMTAKKLSRSSVLWQPLPLSFPSAAVPLRPAIDEGWAPVSRPSKLCGCSDPLESCAISPLSSTPSCSHTLTLSALSPRLEQLQGLAFVISGFLDVYIC